MSVRGAIGFIVCLKIQRSEELKRWQESGLGLAYDPKNADSRRRASCWHSTVLSAFTEYWFLQACKPNEVCRRSECIQGSGEAVVC